MSPEHVDLDTLQRFGQRRLERRRSYEVGVHLLSCARCRGLLARSTAQARSVFARMFPDAPPSPLTEQVEDGEEVPTAEARPADPLERAARAMRGVGERVERERREAPSLADEIDAQPAPRRRWMIDTLPIPLRPAAGGPRLRHR